MDSYVVRIRLIEELAKLRTPVVIKGCMLLRMIMTNAGITSRRGTKDLDLDWADLDANMAFIQATLNTALINIEYGLYAEPFREFQDGQSAGFKIMYNGSLVCKCDVNIAECPFTSYYTTPTGVNFVGSSLDTILADKLDGISTRSVYRRFKDVYDLYLLSHLKVFNTVQVHNNIVMRGRKLGNFSDFLNGKDQLMHAYSKFKGAENKPDFNVVYMRAYTLAEPFILGAKSKMLWDGYAWRHQQG